MRTRITVDDDGSVKKVVNSANNTGTVSVFVNILVINRDFLLKIIDNAEELGYKSFSRDVLIRGTDIYKIYGYELKAYFASIDSLGNYYKHSMELLNKDVRDELFKITSTAKIKNSLIADGCVIEGTVEGSILFRGVRVAKGAIIRNSILFQNTEVGENSRINCVITDKNVRVLENRFLSGHDTHPSFICEGSVI